MSCYLVESFNSKKEALFHRTLIQYVPRVTLTQVRMALAKSAGLSLVDYSEAISHCATYTFDKACFYEKTVPYLDLETEEQERWFKAFLEAFPQAELVM